MRVLLVLILLCLFACAPDPPPNDSGLRVITPLPTLNTANPTALCDVIATNRGRDWRRVLDALHALEAQDAGCGDDFDLFDQLYNAYIAYGTLLERRGQRDDAISAYETALTYNLNDTNAATRLQHLQVATATPPPGCDPTIVETALRDIPDYVPTEGAFVTVNDNQITLDGVPYPVYGVNYYPRDYPNERFLAEMAVETLDLEMELMQASGLNTLRVFLRHDQLFICPGNGAIPHIDAFDRLDTFIRVAAGYGYRLILVLNVEPDLTDFTLYDSPAHTMAQIAYIAARYRAEPAIMAFDVRGGGDADYAPFSPERVLLWLADAVTIIRQNAPDHLVTAGWDDYAEDTAPLVDFVSFQHYGDAESLRQEIAVLTDATTRPILLAAVGYNTFDMDEIGQRQAYQRAFEAVQRNALAGWVVWTAFDYPLTALCDEETACELAQGPRNRYGLWNTSYFPKRALDAVQLATGVITEIDTGED